MNVINKIINHHNTKAFSFVLFVIIAGGVLGNHMHEPPQRTITDLANVQPDRVVVANIFTIGYDLNELALQPGEIVDLVLANSAGSDHSFILSNPFNSLYQYKNNFGEIVLRILASNDGIDNLICTIPGHEGLHTNFIIAN